MNVQLLNIERIEGHDVTFLKLITPHNTWITAYVRFDSPSNRDGGYPTETYNRDNVYGIDTAHCHNESMSIDEKIHDAELQIKKMIMVHDGKWTGV